jgi:hypothetical protein
MGQPTRGNADVIPFEQGEEDLSLVDGGVSDEFGNELFGKENPDELEEEEGLELEGSELEEGNPEAVKPEDKGDKGNGPIPYDRFKEVNEKNITYREENAVLKSQVDNLKNFIESPDVKAVLAQKLAGGTPQQQQAVQHADELSSYEYENKSDQDISNTIANAAVSRTMAQLSPVLSKILENVEGLQTKQTQSENGSFFSKNKMAEENRAAIETVAAERGLSIKDAFFITCGDKLREQGFNEGAKRKAEKSKRDVYGPKSQTPNSKGKQKKYPTVEEAFLESSGELGIDW